MRHEWLTWNHWTGPAAVLAPLYLLPALGYGLGRLIEALT